MYATRPLSPLLAPKCLIASCPDHPADEDVIAIRELWAEHKLLLFRNQSFDEAALVGFSSKFGDLGDPRARGVPLPRAPRNFVCLKY